MVLTTSMTKLSEDLFCSHFQDGSAVTGALKTSMLSRLWGYHVKGFVYLATMETKLALHSGKALKLRDSPILSGSPA